MQKRKIFIEIGLPDRLRKRLTEKIQKWHDLPVKWIRPENLHITLLFLGYVDESVLPDICQKVSKTVSQVNSFEMDFNKIELSPNIQSPQTIQFSGESNEDLKNLYELIEKSLNIFQSGKKQFKPHIILGRIRKTQWETVPEIPVIKEAFQVSISVNDVLIMENAGQEGGQDYHVIETCSLI